MADSYDDYLADDQGGGAVATSDDSYAEYLRQTRQDSLAKKRRDQQAPATAPVAPPAAQPMDLAMLGLSALPNAPATGRGVQAGSDRMALAPADVTRTRSTPAYTNPLGTGEGLDARLAREAHEASISGVVGQFAEDQGAGALGMIAHPVDAAGELAKRVFTAPADIVRGVGNVGARALTSVAERAGLMLPRSSEDTPTYGESARQIGGGVFDTALLTEPAIGGAAKLAGAGRDAMYTAAAGESRFQSALERARTDALAARARRADMRTQGRGGQGGPLALPPGQYDLGPSSFETRGMPETDPSRLLTERAIGAGVPTETGATSTAPIALPPVGDIESSVRAHNASGVNSALDASTQDVETYRRMRDQGVGTPGREVGSPTMLPGESYDDFATRVGARADIRDTAIERSAMADERATPADVEAAARSDGKFSTASTKGGTSRPISQFPQLTDDALHAHMADLIDTKLGAHKGSLQNSYTARLNAAEAELESRGMSTEDIWTQGLERGRTMNNPERAGFTAAGPLGMIVGAGTGALVGAAAAPEGHAQEGAVAGAVGALGLVAVGARLARDGGAIETAASRTARAAEEARADAGYPSRTIPPQYEAEPGPRPPGQVIEEDPLMKPFAPGEYEREFEQAFGRPPRRRAGAVGEQPPVEGEAPKDWRQVRAEALGEPAPQQVRATPGSDAPSLSTGEHTPELIRAAADDLDNETPNVLKVKELMHEVANGMENRAGTADALSARDALDSHEEDNAARDMTFTPEHYDAVRKILSEAPKPEEVAPRGEVESTPRTGAVDPRVVKTLGLAALGGVTGSTIGDTPEERKRNAVLGVLGGGAAGVALSREAKVLTAGEKAELGADVSGAREKPTPKEAADAITATFAPASRGPLAAQTAQTMRAARGTVDREVATAQTTLDRIAGDLNKQPIGKKLGFVDAIEGGRKQGETTGDASRQPVANSIRRTLDEERDKIRALGTGKLDQFIEDYFPHLWQDENAAKNWLAQVMGKKPFAGSKAFLKKRTIPTVLDGMFPEGVPTDVESMTNDQILAENKRQGGLVPVTFNPVEATMLKLREMKKYRMAQEVISDLDTRGLLPSLKEGERMPVGYARIGDWAFTNKVAPEPVAKVLNNYFSPGLRGNAAYDAYMAVGNTLNQAQLGLSAFHAGMTTIEAMVSHNALSLEKLFQGKPGEALKRFATSGAGLLAPIENYKRGSELLAAYHQPPGTLSGPIAAIAEGVAQGGGRPYMEGFDKATKAFTNAREAKQYGRMAKQFMPALLENTTGLVMNHLVPRQKYGVFYDLMQSELEKLGPQASADAVTQAAQKAWDSVDNRMGSLVHDNLFWNKAAKDVLHASVRSVGWNWGTLRELGGGGKDLAGMMKDIVTGKSPELSHRAAYTLALPMTVGMLGAITQYLYTGKGPETLQDYFQPRTGTKDQDGNDNRIQLPTYMKDVLSYGTHPAKTFTNKLNPLLGMLYDTWTDKNFYGDEIYNGDDPFIKELGQTAKYVGKESMPFFIQNLTEGKKRGESLSEIAPSFVGVTPASREAVRTKAQNMMAEYYTRVRPSRTPEEADAAKIRADLREKVKTHGAAAAMEDLRAHVRDGTLSMKQVQNILTDDKTPGLVKRFKSLPLPEAEKVYAAGSAREKQLWAPILTGKRERRQ